MAEKSMKLHPVFPKIPFPSLINDNTWAAGFSNASIWEEQDDNFAKNSASLFLTEFVTKFVVDGTGATDVDGTEVPDDDDVDGAKADDEVAWDGVEADIDLDDDDCLNDNIEVQNRNHNLVISHLFWSRFLTASLNCFTIFKSAPSGRISLSSASSNPTKKGKFESWLLRIPLKKK